MLKEGERFGHKVDKYMIRPLKDDPKVIGKVAAIALVAYFCPPALGTLAGTGGIVAAGATSAAYDKFVFNAKDRDVFKSFLTGAVSATVTAAFNKYWPTEVKIEVTDPVTGVTQTVTEKVVLSTSEQYLRGVAMSVSHIAVSQAAEYIVHGKDGNFLEGGALSGAIVGAFVPSVSMLTGVDDTTFALGGIEIAGSSIVPSVDAFARSVVEQSVANKFNMKKVDFGSAVASGAQAWRDQFVREKATEFAKFVENWYEARQVKSYAQGEIDADKDDLGMGNRKVPRESYAQGELNPEQDDIGVDRDNSINNEDRNDLSKIMKILEQRAAEWKKVNELHDRADGRYCLVEMLDSDGKKTHGIVHWDKYGNFIGSMIPVKDEVQSSLMNNIMNSITEFQKTEVERYNNMSTWERNEYFSNRLKVAQEQFGVTLGGALTGLLCSNEGGQAKLLFQDTPVSSYTIETGINGDPICRSSKEVPREVRDAWREQVINNRIDNDSGYLCKVLTGSQDDWYLSRLLFIESDNRQQKMDMLQKNLNSTPISK